VRIAVVDHGAGNLVSIAQGLERAGAEVIVADTPDALAGVDGVVLPGVGATASVMEGIRAAGFEEPLGNLDIPLFGICVGMQVLFESSEEDGARCLGLIGGEVRRLRNAPHLPHIGWNELELVGDDPLFEGLGPEPIVYFVHSYAPVAEDAATVIGRSSYDDPFTAAVRSGRVSGTQFHPERSGETGLRILANFVAECRQPVVTP
jgi:imidazole glycerol-phosphate synthase subunit HisH